MVSSKYRPSVSQDVAQRLDDILSLHTRVIGQKRVDASAGADLPTIISTVTSMPRIEALPPQDSGTVRNPIEIAHDSARENASTLPARSIILKVAAAADEVAQHRHLDQEVIAVHADRELTAAQRAGAGKQPERAARRKNAARRAV